MSAPRDCVHIAAVNENIVASSDVARYYPYQGIYCMWAIECIRILSCFSATRPRADARAGLLGPHGNTARTP